jgi:sec-independent protein translocase protein TatA
VAAIAYPDRSPRANGFLQGDLEMSLGMPELLVILVIIILIFGANRLAGLGKGLGQAIRGFKDEMSDTEDERGPKKG